MATYKLNYSGENIDELLAKVDNIHTGDASTAGLVKLSDSLESDSDASAGVAATPKAVKRVATDASQLKKNKLDKPVDPVVGQFLRVKSITDDGDIVLETVALPN